MAQTERTKKSRSLLKESNRTGLNNNDDSNNNNNNNNKNKNNKNNKYTKEERALSIKHLHT